MLSSVDVKFIFDSACLSARILNGVVSVFINTSCRCLKLNENSLSLLGF